MKLLFLDFDGVLHPIDSGDFCGEIGGETGFVSVRDDAPLFCCLPLLINTLHDHPDVKIVITSTWRRLYSRRALHAFLGELADRYLGETPFLAGCSRHDEIVCFLRENELETAPWLALDDDLENFPADCPNVLWTDPYAGLDAVAAQQLRCWLESA